MNTLFVLLKSQPLSFLSSTPPRKKHWIICVVSLQAARNRQKFPEAPLRWNARWWLIWFARLIRARDILQSSLERHHLTRQDLHQKWCFGRVVAVLHNLSSLLSAHIFASQVYIVCLYKIYDKFTSSEFRDFQDLNIKNVFVSLF